MKLFKRQKTETGFPIFSYKIIDGNDIFFNSTNEIFENIQARSAINTFTNLCTKLSFEVTSSARPDLKNLIANTPSPFLNLPQFIHRVASILATI